MSTITLKRDTEVMPLEDRFLRIAVLTSPQDVKAMVYLLSLPYDKEV